MTTANVVLLVLCGIAAFWALARMDRGRDGGRDSQDSGLEVLDADNEPRPVSRRTARRSRRNLLQGRYDRVDPRWLDQRFQQIVLASCQGKW